MVGTLESMFRDYLTLDSNKVTIRYGWGVLQKRDYPPVVAKDLPTTPERLRLLPVGSRHPLGPQVEVGLQ